MKALPREKSAYSTSTTAKAVEFRNRIYHKEGLLAELTAEKRYKQRLLKVKPLLDAFFSCLDVKNISEKDNLAQAVGYAINEKKYLYTFFEDRNVPIDTNRAEMLFDPL